MGLVAGAISAIVGVLDWRAEHYALTAVLFFGLAAIGLVLFVYGLTKKETRR